MMEDLIHTYRELDLCRNEFNRLKEKLSIELKELLLCRSPVYGLHIRSIEKDDYKVERKSDEYFKGYTYIVCKEDIPLISYIIIDGWNEALVVFKDSSPSLEFEPRNGFFLEGSDIDELFNQDEVMYILDILIGHYYMNDNGELD